MTSGVVIFSRFDSRRLPGKALLDIAGRPMLGRVIDRARRVAGGGRIILATSDRAVDDVLADFAAAEGIDCHRGDAEDVAGRALACAQAFGLQRFARICGDRPVFDPVLVGEMLAWQQETGADLATTAFPSTYPPGLTTEVVAVAALADALSRTVAPDDREHVTAYFYKHPDRYRIVNRTAPAGLDMTGIRLVVDDADDLARMRWICARLPGGAAAGLGDILDLCRSFDGHPRST